MYLLLCNTSSAADKLEWSRVFPPGGQKGTAIEVELTGKFPDWPYQVWSDTDTIQWTCSSDRGKLKAEIAADATLGLHWLRLYNENGATAARPFLVGDSIERNEIEPNDRPVEANEISSYPQTIHGVLSKKGDVDLFSVVLTAGRLLVATVDASKLLQSPMDTNLQILDSNGFVLAENIDHVGLDPYLEFTAPSDGRYVIRVFAFPEKPDSKIGFAGGSDWCYRLRLESQAGAFGSPIAIPMQTELNSESIEAIPEAHVSQAQAMKLSLPVRIDGVIAKANQINYFQFTAVKNVHYRARVLAREFGSMLDPTIAILDAAGKQLAQSDDVASNRDPLLLWKAPKDGEYFFTIADFHRTGGQGFQFQATLEERPEDFTLSIANDWIQATVGKETEIKVKVTRESDFAGTVSVSMVGLPTTIHCSKVDSINGKESSKTVTLKLNGTSTYQGPIQIVAHSKELDEHVRTAVAETNKPIWLSITND
ncbi:MAG: PPC domain-containing protein [Pirellulaceae bacterium]|nr:PPC domain-containing protein [Pirellulaceae bacterium]